MSLERLMQLANEYAEAHDGTDTKDDLRDAFEKELTAALPPIDPEREAMANKIDAFLRTQSPHIAARKTCQLLRDAAAMLRRTGTDVPDLRSALAESEKRRGELEKALRTIADGYDHDGDAHKYNNGACRVCIAEAALATKDLPC